MEAISEENNENAEILGTSFDVRKILNLNLKLIRFKYKIKLLHHIFDQCEEVEKSMSEAIEDDPDVKNQDEIIDDDKDQISSFGSKFLNYLLSS